MSTSKKQDPSMTVAPLTEQIANRILGCTGRRNLKFKCKIRRIYPVVEDTVLSQRVVGKNLSCHLWQHPSVLLRFQT